MRNDPFNPGDRDTPSADGTSVPEMRRTWKIYRIGCVRSGRGYVGVTRRTVEQRVVAHDLLARLRPHLGGPGTLAEAIRCAYEQGHSFETAFVVSRLAETDDPIEARCWERDWIARLGTAAPAGFNIMPGGSSLGGPANAEPITVRHPGRGSLRYASVMAAVADLNAERKADGAVPLRLGVVYARLKLGWAAEEALGLAVHSDARRSRPAFLWHGHAYNTLRELADAEGLPIDTIRSRLHRAKRAGRGPDHDASRDRRSAGLLRRDPRTGRRVRLFLPHPTDRAAVVDVAEFSRLTGVPKATVVHRYQRLRTRLSDDATLPHEEILALLVCPDDRRVVVVLRLPNGKMLCGGVRSLIRQVFARRAVADRRVEKIGASAIRARLRRLPGWPDDLRPDGIAWAFGFAPDVIAAVILPKRGV